MTHVLDGVSQIPQVPTESTIKGAIGPTVELPSTTSRVQLDNISQSLSIVTLSLATLVSWSNLCRKRGVQALQECIVEATRRCRAVLIAKKTAISSSSFETLVQTLLDVARQCSLKLLTARPESVPFSFAADLCCRLIVDLLDPSYTLGNMPLSDLSQESVCWGLHAIASIAFQNDSVSQSFHLHLTALVLRCIGDPIWLDRHSKDFQVLCKPRMLASTNHC